jgi:hypothetical protein
MAWIDNFDLNFTASIYSRTWTPNGMGGGSYTEALRATISCAIWQNSANEQFIADRLKDKSTHTLACAPNSNFAADDIIKVGGITYKITRPNDILGEGDLMTIGLELVQ